MPMLNSLGGGQPLGSAAMSEEDSDAASAGSMLGPIGALAGAGVSAGASMFDRQSQKKKEKKARERVEGKHSRLNRIKQTMDEQQEKKTASIAAISQAAMQWADMSR